MTQLKFAPPKLLMTCTMTKPTTSSIIAALVRTTPRREVERPLEPRTVKVVPKEVEQSAAPAAKACNGEALRRPCREYDSPIGTAMPVKAIQVESSRLALSDGNEVCSPPA